MIKRTLYVSFFFLFLCSIFAYYVSSAYVITKQDTLGANTLYVAPIPPSPSPTPISLTIDSALDQVINTALTGTKGTYGIIVKNLKTGETYTRDANEVFEPASLYKLWVMATVYQQIEKVILKEDDVISGDVAVLNRKFGIASGSAELSQGGIKYTVSEALELMITISHNYAALLLSDKVKLSNVKAFLQANELGTSSIGVPPKTTPHDTALFLEKLYKGELGNPENTEKMLALLKRQKLNHKIPKYLPHGTVIAHKTGELDSFTHDAGIVYTDKGDYIIVVLSKSTNPQSAEERIAQVSKGVYEYFAGYHE